MGSVSVCIWNVSSVVVNAQYRRQQTDAFRSQSDARQAATRYGNIRTQYRNSSPVNSQLWPNVIPTQSPPRAQPNDSNSPTPTTSPTSSYPSSATPSRNQSPQQKQRRQSQSLRPQVRLPNPKPPESTRLASDSSSDQRDILSQSTKSPRRHKPSPSTSSRGSTGSNPLTINTKLSINPSSPEMLALAQQTASLTLTDASHEQEWLLLRRDTFSRPPRETMPQMDKYVHIHPLIRKYAGETFPEIKSGEPVWANAVLSRRWQCEETLEDAKHADRERRLRGEEVPVVSGPRTMEQEEMYVVAGEMLERLRLRRGTQDEEHEEERG
jgi:hypothetical protein